MLEVIDKGRVNPSHPTPLLFVHGAYHGAWCWNEHFLDYFAKRRFRAVAVSLRGHGASSTTKPLRRCSIADYVEDLRAAAAELDARPVVIGHSMGGFIVQKYLETERAPAGVLMASGPPSGVWRASLRMSTRHPGVVMRANTLGKSVDVLNTPALAREHLFCATTPDSVVASCITRLQPESRRALVDMLCRDLPRPRRVSTPLLVLGARHDGAVSATEVLSTARAYRTEAQFVTNTGHNMMLESDWAAAAGRIHAWLTMRGF